ncbi:MAG: TolA-binding protein [Limisphaerales bacterium]
MASFPALSDNWFAVMRLSDLPKLNIRSIGKIRWIGLAAASWLFSTAAVQVLAQATPAQPVKPPTPVKVTPSQTPATKPAVSPAPANATTEENLFRAATKALEDGGALLEYAERDFAEFIKRFPQSARISAAVLGQAQSQFRRGKQKAAREFLAGRVAASGKLADEYLYWIAECDLSLEKFVEAEKGFAQLLKGYPGSARALEASHGQGEALLKQKNYPAVIKLLNDPKGVFRTQAALRPKDEIVVLGLLTLGEAILAGGQRELYNPLRSELNHRIAPGESVSFELHWRWTHLEYRISMAAGNQFADALNPVAAKAQFEDALKRANSLISMAGEIADKEWLGDSISSKAEALVQLGKADEAVKVYEEALNPKMPSRWQREALNRIVALRINQNKNVESIASLGTILTKYQTAPDLDLIHLTIGEMSLGEFEARRTTESSVPPTTLTNTTLHLGKAYSSFDLLIINFTNSSRLATAYLHRGECLEIVGEDAKALGDFAEASARAGATTNRVIQARAIFKMGDSHFRLTNYMAAVTNYLRSLDDFGDLPEVKNGYGDRAIHQIATAAIRMGELKGLHLAQTALKRMRSDYPRSELYGRSALQVGQALIDVGKYEEAEKVFSNCIADFAKNGVKLPLSSELKLASSLTHSFKGDHTKGIAAVTEWLASEENKKHSLVPRAQFELGRLNSNAGQFSNTFGIYTNFVAAHKTNALSAFAYQWLADYYFNKIDKDVNHAPTAEKYYLTIFQTTNWPPSELTHRARFMAGQCAVKRSGWNEARDRFSKLAGDKEASDEWRARAYFAIGDVTILEPRGDKVERWSKAINVFNQIATDFAKTTLHPLALGRLGHCNLQKGSYDDAIRFYQLVIDHSAVDVASRNEAHYAMGVAFRAKARLQNPPDPKLLALARNQWREVYHFEKQNQEHPAPYWLERATLAFADSLIEDSDAKNVLRRLQKDLPHLHKAVEARIKARTAPVKVEASATGSN